MSRKEKLEAVQNGMLELKDELVEMRSAVSELVDFYVKVKELLHYPEDWDVAAYPTLYDAVFEIVAWGKVCKEVDE